MHDAEHLAAGGKKASQSEIYAWYVFDRSYFGPPITMPVSIFEPDVRMPWAAGGLPALLARACKQCGRPYQARRADSRFCGDTCRQRAHRAQLAVT